MLLETADEGWPDSWLRGRERASDSRWHTQTQDERTGPLAETWCAESFKTALDAPPAADESRDSPNTNRSDSYIGIKVRKRPTLLAQSIYLFEYGRRVFPAPLCGVKAVHTLAGSGWATRSIRSKCRETRSEPNQAMVQGRSCFHRSPLGENEKLAYCRWFFRGRKANCLCVPRVPAV